MLGKCTSSSRCKSATTPAFRPGRSSTRIAFACLCLLLTLLLNFTRYFEGVQGDKSKQGELFGIKNIFKLHEHTYATKMAVSPCSQFLTWTTCPDKSTC